MNTHDKFKEAFKIYLINKRGLASGTADDYASHINQISNHYSVGVSDLFDPDTMKVYGRLDDDTMKKTDADRWMNALEYYKDFLMQLV